MKLFSKALVAAWSIAMLAATASTNVEASTAIVNVNTGMCMDLKDFNTLADAPFQEYQCLGSANQLFDFDTISTDTIGNETVEIKVRHTGMCVSIFQNSVALREAIVQEPCNNSAQQQWKIGRASSPITFSTSSSNQFTVGSARVSGQFVNVSNGLCISVDPGTGNSGSVFQYTCGAVNNLNWHFSYF